MRKYCGAWTRSAHACTRRGGPMNSGADNCVILYFSAVVGIGKDSSILERLGSLGQSMLKASRLRLRRRSQAAERFLQTRHAEDTSLRRSALISMLDEIRDVILVLNFTGSRRFFHIFKPILPTSKPEPAAAAAVSVIPPNSPAAIAAAAVAASDLDEQIISNDCSTVSSLHLFTVSSYSSTRRRRSSSM
jgi:hypothetical protein